MKYILSILLLLFAGVLFAHPSPQHLNPEISILSESPDFDMVNEITLTITDNSELSCRCNPPSQPAENLVPMPESDTPLILPYSEIELIVELSVSQYDPYANRQIRRGNLRLNSKKNNFIS